MMRKLTTMLAAAAVALTALAPATPADARHRRDRDYGYDCRYDRDCDRYDRRRHDDNNDEVAAGVIGLALGVALGAMISNSGNNDRRAPPPRYDDHGRYDDRGRYEDQGSAYERDYGSDGRGYQQCTRRERQWDRYAQRYVVVDVPC